MHFFKIHLAINKLVLVVMTTVCMHNHEYSSNMNTIYYNVPPSLVNPHLPSIAYIIIIIKVKMHIKLVSWKVCD